MIDKERRKRREREGDAKPGRLRWGDRAKTGRREGGERKKEGRKKRKE